jgi:hypothetical protein
LFGGGHPGGVDSSSGCGGGSESEGEQRLIAAHANALKREKVQAKLQEIHRQQEESLRKQFEQYGVSTSDSPTAPPAGGNSSGGSFSGGGGGGGGDDGASVFSSGGASGGGGNGGGGGQSETEALLSTTLPPLRSEPQQKREAMSATAPAALQGLEKAEF